MVSPRILIVMPAHNEAENLPIVLPELRRLMPDTDIVIIDDFSVDATAQVAAELGAEVVSLPCNLGYGGAVQTGFKYAVERGYEYGVMLDADGQHDPACIADLLAPVLAGDADVVIGSRFLGKLDYASSWVRRAGQKLFAHLTTWLTGRRVTDPTSGFQALNREALEFFARDNYPADYPDADTVLLLNYAGFVVQEAPVRMRSRLAGVAMHGSSWKIVYYIFKMFLSLAIILLRQTTRSNARRTSPQPGQGHRVDG